jgi:hypothetical protein
MTADEKRIAGVTDGTELATIRNAVVSLVAAEKQRVKDKAESDALRAQVRIDDDRWKGDTGSRLDRVQATQTQMAAELARLHMEVGALPTALDGKLTAAALAGRVEQTAAKLEVERQLTAVQLAIEPFVKKGADGVVVRKFLSSGMRLALSILACVLLIGLSVAMFTQHTDWAGDIGGILFALGAVVAIIYGNRQK